VNIIIYGKGDFAKLVYYYLKNDSKYVVCGFCVDEKYLDSEVFCELPLISFESIEKTYPSSSYKIFVAIGYANMRARKIMYMKAKDKGYQFINYISSKAYIDSSVVIGVNNIVLQGSTIEAFVEIGDNNIIWASCNISHNVKIESHSFISTQSLIGGFSEIKNNCFLGFNSTVIDNVIIENETLVGAKTLILKNTQKYTKYIGNPAKKVSTHKNVGIHIK